jgi:hypothetical protein
MDRKTVCEDAIKLLNELKHYHDWTQASITLNPESGLVEVYAFDHARQIDIVHLLTNGKSK